MSADIAEARKRRTSRAARKVSGILARAPKGTRDVVLIGAPALTNSSPIYQLSLELAHLLVQEHAVFVVSQGESPEEAIAKVEAVSTATLRVVLLMRAAQATPILHELERLRALTTRWVEPVDLLRGLGTRDRFTFLERAIRLARERPSA